jgi:LacI family transcriptional regulator
MSMVESPMSHDGMVIAVMNQGPEFGGKNEAACRGMIRLAGQTGVRLLFRGSRRLAAYGRYGDWSELRRLSVRGLISLARLGDQDWAQLADLAIPVVFGFHAVTDSRSVVPDPLRIAQEAVQHLRVRGYSQLAWYAGAQDQTNPDLAQRRCHLQDLGVQHCYDPERCALADWLQELSKPVGICCGGDLLAIRILETCREVGLAVPQQVGVLGADDDPLVCDYSQPPLSSIDMAGNVVGETCLQQLLQCITHPDRSPETILVPPRGVVPRTSTDVTLVGDPVVAAVLEHLRRQVTRDELVATIAAEVGLSESQLRLRFKRACGESVSQARRRLRIERAKYLLLNTDLAIGQIAPQVGMPDPGHFARQFTRQAGCSPARWREQARRADGGA